MTQTKTDTICNSPYYKVRWEEGMLVSPQHFQQWDHYVAATQELRIKHLQPFSWGVIDMAFSQEMLGCDFIELVNFQGIFPSGTVINIPCTDLSPPSRQKPELPPLWYNQPHPSPTIGVFLALPLQPTTNVSGNCPPKQQTDMIGDRYLTECVTVLDENNGHSNIELTALRHNVQIRFETELNAGYEMIRIAEIDMNENVGKIVLSSDFIPPCLTLAASANMITTFHCFIQQVTDILTRLKSHEVSGSSSIASPWLVSLTQGILMQLKHFDTMLDQIHPETVFRALLQYAGQLGAIDVVTYDLQQSNSGYQHEQLMKSFTRLQNSFKHWLRIAN